ncbi:MAG: DUF1840 domain-containing protein [Burkholderiales bacterium]|nr:DUF1840 domain-containing protein [Burkholderiales bacterium]
MLLITFQSSAAAEITMYKAHVKELLDTLDKNTERGVITCAEIDHVMQILEGMIAKDKQERQAQEQMCQDDDEIDRFELKNKNETVSLSARFFPLIEMLKLAQKKQKDIIWGV